MRSAEADIEGAARNVTVTETENATEIVTVTAEIEIVTGIATETGKEIATATVSATKTESVDRRALGHGLQMAKTGNAAVAVQVAARIDIVTATGTEIETESARIAMIGIVDEARG